MNINIRVSNYMTVNTETNNENLYIRVPEDIRIKYNLRIGNYVNFNNKGGGTTTLKVEKSYMNDAFFEGSLDACVTEEIYNRIRFEDPIEVINTINLGADPEYFLLDLNGGLLDARAYFTKWDMVGTDGLLGEIRPSPDLCSKVVTANIGKLLDTAKKAVGDDVSMVASSFHRGISAGFHLHFGIPQEILNKKDEFSTMIRSVVRALDFYLAPISTIVEGSNESGRRSAPSLTYGKVSDYRVRHNTLEYRVPGGCLLKHPILTGGLLALGATIVEDAISRYKVLTNDFTDFGNEIEIADVYPNIPDLKELFRIICTPDSSLARQYLTNIREDVSKMLGYEKRKTEIDLMFDNIDTYFSRDIGLNWNLKSDEWSIQTNSTVRYMALN